MEKDSLSKSSMPSWTLLALGMAYYLLISLVPIEWLKTDLGLVAFDVTSKLNPYLSDYEIAFAPNQNYFIKCHILVNLIFFPTIPFLTIRALGGFHKTRNEFVNLIKKIFIIFRMGRFNFYWILSSINFVPC